MSDASELAGIHWAIAGWADDPDIGAMAASDADDLRQCVAVFGANETRNRELYEIYEGTVPLRKVPSIVPERYRNLRIGCPWPEVAVQSVVERSRLSRFVFPDDEEAERRMAQIAERCDLALGYQSALTDALVVGVSFAAVGIDEAGPCVRWHTAQSAAGIWDYAHGRLRCGFAIVDRERRKAVTGDEASDTVPSKVDFYTPRGVWELTRDMRGRSWSASWVPDSMGEPRMVALVFRPDGKHPLGRSRFTHPMRSIVQEYMANALNLHVASEFTALGQKWATGLSDKQLDAFAERKWVFTADSAILATDNPDSGGSPQFGNFTQQSMEPILSVKRSLATDFAAAASIPISELLTQDSNPTSAEALTAAKDKLISLVESVNARNMSTLRRIALMLMALDAGTGTDGLSEEQLSVMVHMRRPETTSAAAESDAIMKKCSTLPFLAMSDVAIEEAGFTEDQQERLKSERDRYLSRQAVLQAAQAAGLDLSGGQRAGEAS